ncbi:MAG: hypothetical protein ACI4XM_01285 [Candidatus Coprovivens sp.]
MIRDKIINEYFDWLCYFTKDKKHTKYRKLLTFLHNKEFVVIIPNDSNRAADGIDLRWRFACELDYDRDFDEISRYLDRPCSVLEMMIALAIRCEEHIMEDPDIGNRTSEWFWIMIRNLGLHSMNDTRFNIDKVDEIVSTFLYREYKRNGEGGLFIVDNLKRDMCDIEIWYQMCWYLDNIL